MNEENSKKVENMIKEISFRLHEYCCNIFQYGNEF